jgi:aminopeptidase
VEAASDDMLGWTPPWMVARLERAIEVGAAIIGVSADSGAEVYEGLDGERLARARFRDFDRVWMEGIMGRKLAWSLVAYPTEGWAREALGEPDVDRLWDAFAHALRLDEPDPAAAWEARLDELQARARELTARAFTGAALPRPGHRPRGRAARGRPLAGRPRAHRPRPGPRTEPPHEEVFTSPHRERAEGTVRSTMPLALHGTIIEGLELRVAGGEIVEARATRGEDALRTELAVDDGARRFGEVALVDASSRVGETGVIFNNTLFDENAAAHIAWGNALPWALDDLPPDQHVAAASTSRRPTPTSWSAHPRSRSTASSPAARRCRCCARASGSCRRSSAGVCGAPRRKGITEGRGERPVGGPSGSLWRAGARLATRGEFIGLYPTNSPLVGRNRWRSSRALRPRLTPFPR